jgi:hypothetical protein
MLPYADIRLFSHLNLKSLRKLNTSRKPRNNLVCVYRLIFGSIVFDFSHGKENEINAMLYCVYTKMYSVQISTQVQDSIYTYVSVHTDTKHYTRA